MKALSLIELGKFELQEREIPVPGKGEVLVKVGAAGVCGSDIPRAYVNGPYHYPLVLGHEFSGTIKRLGEDVDEGLKGKKVAIFPLFLATNVSSVEKNTMQNAQTILILALAKTVHLVNISRYPNLTLFRLMTPLT